MPDIFVLSALRSQGEPGFVSKKQKTQTPLPRGTDISVDRARGSVRRQDFPVDRVARYARRQDFPVDRVARYARGAVDSDQAAPEGRVGRLSRGSKVWGVEVLSDVSCAACGSRTVYCSMVVETPGTAAGPNQGFSRSYRERASRSILVACQSCGIEGKGSDINEAIEAFRRAGDPILGVVDTRVPSTPSREPGEQEVEFLQDRIRYLRGIERDLTNEISELEYRVETRETDVQDLENKILESRARDLTWLEEARPPRDTPASLTQDTETEVPILDPPYVVDGLGNLDSPTSQNPTGTSLTPGVNSKPDPPDTPDPIAFRNKIYRKTTI
jgi:hypothetical protein